MVQEGLPETSDEEQSEEAPKQVQSKEDVSFWRYTGKSYSLRHESWLSRSELKVACRCESSDDTESQVMKDIIEQLDFGVIKPGVRVTKEFQSEVCFCLSQSQKSGA